MDRVVGQSSLRFDAPLPPPRNHRNHIGHNRHSVTVEHERSAAGQDDQEYIDIVVDMGSDRIASSENGQVAVKLGAGHIEHDTARSQENHGAVAPDDRRKRFDHSSGRARSGAVTFDGMLVWLTYERATRSR